MICAEQSLQPRHRWESAWYDFIILPIMGKLSTGMSEKRVTGDGIRQERQTSINGSPWTRDCHDSVDSTGRSRNHRGSSRPVAGRASAHRLLIHHSGSAFGDGGWNVGSLPPGSGLAKVKDFSLLWRRSAAASLSLAGCLVLIGLAVPGSVIFFSVAAGILPGIVDLVGLGLRLPLWAKLNQRAALTSINLRLFSRLILLGVFV